MLNIITEVVIFVSPILIYLDATKNKIGRFPDNKEMFNLPASSWAIITLSLWIIGVPAYLIKRKSFINKAKKTPIEAHGRVGKTIGLAVIGGLWILIY